MSSEALELRRSIACLAVEVPGEVWDDVNAKAEAVLAALAVAREREQRRSTAIREAAATLERSACFDVTAPVVRRLRAALVDEPAAGPQLGGGARRAITEHGAALEALAAADEPSTSPTDYGPHDHFWRDFAAADEPNCHTETRKRLT